MKKPENQTVLVIDNYDSFTYNLVQYLGELGANPIVYRNDKITLKEIHDISPSKIVISPGPGIPSNAGITKNVIREFDSKVPILGICLGHQAIGEVFGGKVKRAPELRHGKLSEIFHNSDQLFKGVEMPFSATRYHSLIVERSSIPENLEITAWTEDNLVMGVRVKGRDTFGVQFHPESIMTLEGKAILENFLCCRN